MFDKFLGEIRSRVVNDGYLRHIRDTTGKEIIIDTNLLILLLIGTIDVNYIEKFNRTKNLFTKNDYYFLSEIINIYYTKIITTPHILTEVNYFADEIKETYKSKANSYFTSWLSSGLIEERYIESEILCGEVCFKYLGLADTSIVKISKKDLGIISMDGLLCSELINNKKLPVIDFNNYTER